MVAPPCLPANEIAAVHARWRADLPPLFAADADALLARISPPRWALEWSLPRWLGDALSVEPAHSSELVLANVYGLAYIRIQDDLLDGDAPPAERVTAGRLSDALYPAWLAVYRRLLGSEPAFWARFEQYLAQWRQATLASTQPMPTSLRAFTAADFATLGQRGAPLKVCAAAACILAQRQEWLPPIEAILDELLIAAVLLDHAVDWRADLAAGRANAFVAYAAAQPQTGARRGANRLAVLNELAAGATGRPYFALIHSRLAVAAGQAEALGLMALAHYIAWLGGQARTLSRNLSYTTRQWLRRATSELLPGVA